MIEYCRRAEGSELKHLESDRKRFAFPFVRGGGRDNEQIVRNLVDERREEIVQCKLPANRPADASNCKIIGHFSIKNHRFSGATLHYLCIFNGNSKNKLAIYIAIRSTRKAGVSAAPVPRAFIGVIKQGRISKKRRAELRVWRVPTPRNIYT